MISRDLTDLDDVPQWCSSSDGRALRTGNGSTCSRQVDERIITHCGNRLRCRAARGLNGTLIIFLQEQSAEESADGVMVGKDANHLSSLLHFSIQSLNRVPAVKLGPARCEECHACEHISLGAVHETSELRDFRPDLIGSVASLLPGGFRRVLSKRPSQ